MPDREKVILGIENCLQTDSVTECSRTKCPFIKCRESCLEWLLRCALALLREQEPRVMTLEEVRRHDGAVFLARDDGTGDWAICCDEAADTLTFVHGSRRGHIASYKKDAYGPRWSCWTSRPTDEQREAEPWE